MFHVVCINDDWLGAEHEGATIVPQVVFPKKGVVYTVKKTVIGCIKQRVMYHLYELNYEGLCFTYKGNDYIGLGFPVEHFRPLQKLLVEQFTTRPVKENYNEEIDLGCKKAPRRRAHSKNKATGQ